MFCLFLAKLNADQIYTQGGAGGLVFTGAASGAVVMMTNCMAVNHATYFYQLASSIGTVYSVYNIMIQLVHR